MKPENEHIGYAHDHLGAIQQGMPVFDVDNVKIGVVHAIEFAPETDEGHVSQDPHLQSAPDAIRAQLLKSGFIKVHPDQSQEAYYAAGSQIQYVNEGAVQLNVSGADLLKV